MNIVLTGFMGVGKSTVGRLLADRLKMSFVDTDSEIEKRFGMTVAEIFSKHGEECFRKSEAELARELGEKQALVIATGGGMVKNPENLSRLKKNAVVVNLYCGVEKILSNIKDTSTRPLIHGKSRQQILKLMEDRAYIYRNADVRVSTESASPAEVVSEIEKIYEERSRIYGKIRNSR